MRHKLAELLVFLILFGSIGYIYGQAGALELGTITIKQAIIRGLIGLGILAVSTLAVNIIYRKGETV